MSARNRGRRGRSRKRRPATHAGQEAVAAGKPESAQRSATSGQPAKRAARAPRGRLGELQPFGERPQAPWHPLPLAELLILIGGIGFVVGLSRGISLTGPEQISGRGVAPLVAGIVAIVVGTIEVTLREHRSGYRSHTLMLALLPPLALYSIVVLVVSAFTPFPRWLNIPLLLICGGLFAFLWKVLRASFADARRERRFGSRR